MQGEVTKGEQVKSYSGQCPSARALIRTNQCYALPAPGTMLRYARHLALMYCFHIGHENFLAPAAHCREASSAAAGWWRGHAESSYIVCPEYYEH
eukprot:COSAG02_NODE_789_length_17189_cov_23.034114_19_plen_95_part_00